MPSLLNSVVGEYRLTDFLGAGGMGEVYRAVHPKLGRTVAIKVLTQLDAKNAERFLNEARIQSRLRHPGIAVLYDFSEHRGLPCIIMELIEGETVAQRIRRKGPLPVAEALGVLKSVLASIGYVHSQGVVHRDLKSNNVKITPASEVKLLDFGIARAPGSRRLTQAGYLIGTAENLAPEQLEGKEADYRSDIWALGVLLYEMLTGRLPFEAQTVNDLYARILRSDCARPSELNPAVPRAMDDLVMRCLRKKPADRFQSAHDMQHAVERLGKGGTGPLLTLPGRPPRRALIAAGGALLVMVAVGVVWRPWSEEHHDPSDPPLTGRQVTIDVVGGAAEVFRDGQPAGKTPYLIPAEPGQRIQLLLKRTGSQDLTLDFEAGEKTTYMYTMEPAIQ